MTTITEIIGRVNTQLVDPMMVRWPLQELCDYYNDAVRAVILANRMLAQTGNNKLCSRRPSGLPMV